MRIVVISTSFEWQACNGTELYTSHCTALRIFPNVIHTKKVALRQSTAARIDLF
jgi:hypothetical protein